MPGGRPSDYNNVIAKKIIDRISEGETVTKICKDPEMPNRSTVWLWSATHPEFSVQYKKAIASLGQCEVDQIDEIEAKLERGEIDAPTARVLIDSKKWKAGKFYEKMYGDKSKVESTNVNHNLNTELPLTDADLDILKRYGFDGE